MDFQATPMSFILLIVNVAVSLYAMYGNNSLYSKLILCPYEFFRERNYYTLITSGFIHADTQHLLFNMFSFYFFAFTLESIVGSIDFTLIYFGSLVLADVPSLLKHKDDPNYRSLGASGAVSGIVFSTILFAPLSKMIIFPLPIPIPAFIYGVLYLVWCIYAAKKSDDMINHSAHLWGSLAGLGLTIILDPMSIEIFLSNFTSFL